MENIKHPGGPPRHKGPNWKEIFAGETCKKYAFWFLIGFLAALTIKDVVELVNFLLSSLIIILFLF